MSARTGLGLLEVAALTAVEQAGGRVGARRRAYGWWLLKPLSMLGAALCAGNAVTRLVGGRLPSLTSTSTIG